MSVLLERFPYRFVETEERGFIEKYNLSTKRWSHMYECSCERQMLTAIEDIEYVKWLDPAGVPCYVRSTVTAPYPQEVTNDK
jgi:hypothetical protein